MRAYLFELQLFEELILDCGFENADFQKQTIGVHMLIKTGYF
jgi:hypothetical protein